MHDAACTRFGLLRHAPTAWNLSKRIQGHQDSHLTPAGEVMSSNWGEQLTAYPWERILSSDLGRAVETAERINRSLKVPRAQTESLRELDWGSWTGKSIREIKAETPEALKELEQAGWNFCPPGGESRTSVWHRSRDALLTASEKWPGETILVVTHEGVIKCLLYGLAGRKFLPQEPAIIDPFHLHWLASEEKGLKIERLNAVRLEPAFQGYS